MPASDVTPDIDPARHGFRFEREFYDLTTMQRCLRAASLRQSDLAEARSLIGPARKR
jgi:hypothetical protein